MQHFSLRARWLLVTLTILLVGGLALFSLSLTQHSTQAAGVETGADWDMYGHDAGHTGYNALETVLNTSNVSGLTSAWSVPGTASPAEANGILYVPDSSTLFALDAATGATLWTFAPGSSINYPVVSGSIVYVSTTNTIYALDAATGTQLWSHTFQGTIPPSPTVANGMVFISISNRKVWALDAATGAERWSFWMDGGVGYSSPAYANGALYIGLKIGHGSILPGIVAINATTGKMLWNYGIPGRGRVESSPVVSNGIVYIGSLNHSLYAIDAATGVLRWSYTTWAVIYAPPAVDNNTVYVAPGGRIYALDAVTGALLWRKTYDWNSHTSPIVANGVIYFGPSNLYAINAKTGKLLYTCAQCGTNPIVANGVVYVTASGGQIAAYHLPG